MKRITLLFLAIICVLTLQAQNWQFNTDGDAEGWAGVAAATQVTIEGGLLKAVHDIGVDAEGPKISATGLSLDASSYTTVIIHLKTVDWDGAGKQLRFFWATDASPGLDGNKLITVGVNPDADNFQTLKFDLNNAHWTGTITQIRLDLCMYNGKEVHVDYIELIYTEPVDNFIDVLMDFENPLGTDGYVVESTQGYNSADRIENPLGTGINTSDWVLKSDLNAYPGTARVITFSFDENISMHGRAKARMMVYSDPDDSGNPVHAQMEFYDANDNMVSSGNQWFGAGYNPGEWVSAVWAGNSLKYVTFRKIKITFWDDWGASGVARPVYIDNFELYNDGDVYEIEEYTLTVSVIGNGSVEVDEVAYTDVVTADEGTVLSLKAIADAGYVFDGWSGDLTSANADETITMDADKTVTATFSEIPPFEYAPLLMDFELPLGTDGYNVESAWGQIEHGVIDNPVAGGINASAKVYKSHREAGNWNSGIKFVFDSDVSDLGKTKARVKVYPVDRDLNHVYFKFYDESGTVVSEAWNKGAVYPAGEWSYAEYSKDITGLSFRKVDLNFSDSWGNTTSESTVYIDDLELFSTQHTLTVNVSGNGAVEVDGVAYTEAVHADVGAVLSLKAIADAGYVFDGWSGDLTSVNTDETITMDADKTVTATFIEDVPVEVVDRWEFETAGDAEGWSGVGTATHVTIENGLLKAVHDIAADNEGPKIIQSGLSLDASSYARAVIHLKTVDWNGAGKQFRFFWGKEDSPGLDGNKLITVGGITPDADNFQTIEVDLNHAQWTGTITQMRMDLCMWEGKEVHVDYIRLLKMPEVTVVSLAQVQIGDDITAQSSEDGKLYLVPSATNTVIADIEAAAGTNVLDVTANTDATFATTDLAVGDYVIYAVSEDGLLSAASKTITLTEATVLTYTVTIIVNDGSAAIEGAVVTFDGNDVTTGSDGKAIFTDVTAASYAYSVSAAGFDDASGNITVADADVDETVSLTASAPIFTVTFVVDDGSEVIEGAVVTMNSSSVATDDFGMAVFTGVEAGDYAYTVTANGFSEASGSVTVSDADVQETVSLGEFTTDAVEWYFDTDGNSEGWVPNSEITTLEVQGGIMTAYSDNWTGPEIRIFGLNFSSDDYTHIEINMKTRVFAENEAKQVRVFWNDPAAERLVLKDFTANADDFQVLEIDMSGHELWTGQITDMRFDVCYGHGKEIDIDYIKMTNPGGSNAVSEKMVNFGVYPNPASGAVYVFGNWNAPVDYRIISITGETVSQGSISAEDRQINLEGVSSGIYFITIKNQASKLIVR